MRAQSSAALGPNCTRYKPKYSLIDPDVKGFNLGHQRVQPTIIEELILKRYKEFEEAMEGLTHKCNPLLRLQKVTSQENIALAEAEHARLHKRGENREWNQMYSSFHRYDNGKHFKLEQHRQLRVERMRKFYEHILRDINAFCSDYDERQSLI